jgi:hypothetical protein
MVYTGTIKGNVIEFDSHLPFDDGLQVVVDITPPSIPSKGSPQAWLTYFAGTATDEEADIILFGAQECRQIDQKLWNS